MKSLYEWCIENNRKDILQSWDSDKNKNITPSNISYGSNKKYYWLCEIGHSWLMAPKDRRKKGCPYCKGHQLLVGFNDLKTKNSELANEWNYEKNGDLTPDQVTIGCNEKVWWKCSKGHEWEATIKSRNNGRGCPYCSGNKVLKGYNDLLSTNPEIAKEWDYSKNTEKPDEVMAGSNKKSYWFICPKGHSYKSTLLSRKRGSGCPRCNIEKHSSFPEKAIFFYMKKLFNNAEENYKNSIFGTKEIDIYLPTIKVGIEYDGVAWHKDYKRDLEKDKICLNNEILLIRIREIGCHNYESTSLKKYVTPYDMQELNEAILFVINFLNEKYKFKNKISIDVDRDRIKILEQMNLSEKKNSLANYCPEIKNFWDKEKNGKITPEQIPHASFKKVFLKCKKGHEWETTASYFSKNPWCPYCFGRKVQTGYNDLFTTNPELIPYWSKNNTIDPKTIKSGCNSNVLWYCPTCNAEYDMKINDKVKGRGCPYCSGHRVLKGYNDLETTSPDILLDWDYKKNDSLKPNMVTKGSNKKVSWKCHICGHEWEATICNRTGSLKRGCPNCGKEKNVEKLRKAVIQYTMDDKFVAEFKSAMDAERQTGIHQIHRVCRNERKSAGGYKWKYK